MFETPFTVVGNIITNPVRLRFGDQELYKFRVASNSRRRGADGTWEPGNSLYVTVNCWGNLARGVSASLGKGDSVVVVGHLYTNEYEDREGVRRSSVEVRATAVGPDLSRCIARVEKVQAAKGPRADAAVGPEMGIGDAGDRRGHLDDAEDPEDLEASAEDRDDLGEDLADDGLPLTA
ncbi:single-stranded DNA-binding protein [Mycolicibacterium goodii]|uniref:Single-stranded DNA-binding protein n=1 Tax=Mycolicibacterium goodii TaxID=134601 RepID=A0A0K0XG71_MYCGD|nr:single-stranded DNA-binding protein [Mycolicibacterium goodii]